MNIGNPFDDLRRRIWLEPSRSLHARTLDGACVVDDKDDGVEQWRVVVVERELMNTFLSYSSEGIGRPLLLARHHSVDGSIDLLVRDRGRLRGEEDFPAGASGSRTIDKSAAVRITPDCEVSALALTFGAGVRLTLRHRFPQANENGK